MLCGGGRGGGGGRATAETLFADSDLHAVVFAVGGGATEVVGTPGGAGGTCGGGVAGGRGLDDEGFWDGDAVRGAGVADDAAAFPGFC